MRTNLPVTTTEYPISDETLIVSRTDLKGKLTYFNDQFVAAAGFHRSRVDGPAAQHHSPSGYAAGGLRNLWTTLKGGKPWAGAVKNRRKNGDFYWVLATASPIVENGQVTGYTSIRTKLPADQRAEAEQVYAALRAKQAHNYRISAGVIRHRSVFDHLSFFNGTLKARLITLVALQAVFMASIVVVNPTPVEIGLLLAGLAAGGLLGLRTLSVIDGPLKMLNQAMQNVTQGKLDNRMPVERDDEIGEAVRNMQNVQAIVRFNSNEVVALQRRSAEQRKADMSQARR